MISEAQKTRFQRIKLNSAIKDGGQLQYCPKCDWDAESTNAPKWNNCPECGTTPEMVKLTNEVLRLMS